jgi:hypothetical protein
MQILDPQSTPSALDFQPPRAVPFYDGRPWFMPGVFAWLRLRDALDRMTIRRG